MTVFICQRQKLKCRQRLSNCSCLHSQYMEFLGLETRQFASKLSALESKLHGFDKFPALKEFTV